METKKNDSTETPQKNILVTGDVAIDHFYHIVQPFTKGDNWQLFPSLHTTLIPGGSYILADLIKSAVEESKLNTVVIGQKVPEDLLGKEASEMVQAKILLKKYEEEIKGEKFEYLRVEKYLGYTASKESTLQIPPLEQSHVNPSLIVIDDAGNGFRKQKESIPVCIDCDDNLLIYKMSRPLASGDLWEKVSKRKQDWLLVIHAKDIRHCDNVNVSKALSWERTAMEMVFQLKRSSSLSELQKATYLVVLFGTDGALLMPKNQDEEPILVFDPINLEGGFDAKQEGLGISTISAFTAAISVHVIENGFKTLVDGIKNGLSAMRHLLKNGLVEDGVDVKYPTHLIFKGKLFDYSECPIKISNDLYEPDKDFWRILDSKTKLSKPNVTKDIVKNKSPKILKEVPVGQYGKKLQTFDRNEIEQYNSIKNLINEFLEDPKTLRPLCIAVFGPPGAGKSFGIKQVLDSLNRKDIPTMTFNISQYSSYNDLVADFHKIRDKVLTGDIPVAFFDEFDSEKDNQTMGWLKYFLCPMQDGEFKEGEAVHPIGKSIFVFAGGTRSSFSDFENNIDNNSISAEIADKAKDELMRRKQFREAKGPDFVSRLRGFIDILGPNPNHQPNKFDNTFMIRRAKIMRTTFQITEKTKQLINSDGELQIDESVLRAMINIPEYKHGNRSLNAILDMSRLTNKNKFDLSALPTKEQLDMHVDAEVFLWLASNERFYSLLPVEDRFNLKNDLQNKVEKDQPKNQIIRWENDKIEHIAYRIHDNYYKKQEGKAYQTIAFDNWENLDLGYKLSNIDAAADIPVKLAMIGYGITINKENCPVPILHFKEEEILILEKEEHERWCREKRLQGWKYGIERDEILKTRPDMVAWEELKEDTQLKDREAIDSIPEILAEFDFYIYKFEDKV